MGKEEMKKVHVLQPKYDIGDVLAYQFERIEERADDVPVKTVVKNAGRADAIRIDQHAHGVGKIQYWVNEMFIDEGFCKKVNI